MPGFRYAEAYWMTDCLASIDHAPLLICIGIVLLLQRTKALKEQAKILAVQGWPLDWQTLFWFIFDICGKIAGKKFDLQWCHQNNFKRSSTSGLDPKYAQKFTTEHINEFFNLLLGLI